MRKHTWLRGIVSAKYPIQADNYPALANAAQPPEKMIVSRCRFLKILWFKHLKEIEMEPTPPREIINRLPEYNI